MSVLAQARKTIKEHDLLTRGDCIIVAVSGGPDSLTLLHLLLALRDEWQLQLHVAHLNHQLRGAESDADAEFVTQLARKWGLPATVESRDIAAHAHDRKLSIEEAARKIRYAFLADVAQRVGSNIITVAHNADDQVETVLMHLLRGSGLAGLRGMQYRSLMIDYQLQLIRPLLDVTRAEIEAYCKDNSLIPRFDRSNLDTTLFRNRLRHEVLPYLESINPKFREILAHTSLSISDDYDYLESQAQDAFPQVTRHADDATIFNRGAWRQLHPALQRMILRIAILQLRSDLRDIDWTHIEDARRVALDKGAGAVATLPHGLRLVIGYDQFIVGDAQQQVSALDFPQLNEECVSLPEIGLLSLPRSNWVVEIARAEQSSLPLPKEELGWSLVWTATFDAQKITNHLVLRRRRAGDRFQPAGMSGHSKSVHELMIDEKIPRVVREKMPLLADSEKILWVCGYRVDERARATDKTRRILQVTFKKNRNG